MTHSKEPLQSLLKNIGLFHNLSEKQQALLVSFIEVSYVKKGDCIIKENEISDILYIIEEGKVEIRKKNTKTLQSYSIAILESGALLGELSPTDTAPRSASAYALTDCKLLKLPMSKLYSIEDLESDYLAFAEHLKKLSEQAQSLAKETPFYPKVIQNITKHIGNRLRNTNEALVESLVRELEQSKARIAMGIECIGIVTVISIYIIATWIFKAFSLNSTYTPLFSAGLLILITLISSVGLRFMGYPLSFFGVNLNHWKKSLIESILFTIPLLILTLIYKLFLIRYTPDFAHHPLFEFRIYHHPSKFTIMTVILYVLLIFFQELLFRGSLLTSILEFFSGRYKAFWAIFISSLLFSATHIHVSIVLVVITFFFGLFLGWMYVRQRSLLGVTVSHILFAVWGLYIVGVSNTF